MDNRCTKCYGRLSGEPNYTGDFLCTCKPEPTYSMLGWECPRCRTIHAPFVLSCGCAPPTVTTTSIYISEKINQPQLFKGNKD